MLRFCLMACLWLWAFGAWAIPVTLANTGTVAVYAHPSDNDPVLGELPAGSQVDVVATDMSKGYLLIQYKQQQAWIKASSVVNTTNTSKKDDSVQAVLNTAFANAGTKVDAAMVNAQSKISRSLTGPQWQQRVRGWTNQPVSTWLMTGALIFIVGLILGLLLGKMMWRPKRSFLR